jgi:hypothetical protein
VNEAFFSTLNPEAQNGLKLSTSLYIDPSTGKVVDVEFEFLTDRIAAKFPPAVYRRIELELKRHIWFTPTEYGRRLNCIFLNWIQKVGETRPGVDPPFSPAAPSNPQPPLLDDPDNPLQKEPTPSENEPAQSESTPIEMIP